MQFKPIKNPEPDMSTPLIPKSPASQQKHQQTNQTQKPHNHKSSLFLAIKEAKSIANIALPMILTYLLLYSPISMISMLFLGRLGELALAGGSLAVGFSNITGYSILSGLAMGMEPICGLAFGAKKHTLLGLSLQRTVLLLMFTSFPIALSWLNMKRILLFCGQDESVAIEAQSYLLYSLSDLLAQSILHPIRIYIRTQSITLPLTLYAALSILLHIPINYFVVSKLSLGIIGVAVSGVWTNFNLVVSLIIYILISGVYKKTWAGLSMEYCLRGWKSLLNLAISSCTWVCLEWWWYEIMVLSTLYNYLPNKMRPLNIVLVVTALVFLLSIKPYEATRVPYGEVEKWMKNENLQFQSLQKSQIPRSAPNPTIPGQQKGFVSRVMPQAQP